MFYDEMEERIKKVFNLVFVMSIVKNYKKKEPEKRKSLRVHTFSVSPI